VRTRVGYAGGTSSQPTYYNLGDHTETIQIDFDPAQISYGELLEVFWQSHNPVQPSYSRQYASLIFFHDEEQKKAALASKQREEDRRGRKVFTEIVPAGAFHLAEDYHQKYYLQRSRTLMAEFTAMYPNVEDFVNSTAVARANGYLGGNGSRAQLEAELGSLGLSAEGEQELVRIVR